MRWCASQVSSLLVAIGFLCAENTCLAQHTIAITSPPNGHTYANGTKIRPGGTSNFHGSVKIKVTNAYNVNGQMTIVTYERTVQTDDEFMGWDYGEEITILGGGYWKVEVWEDGDPMVYTTHYGPVMSP